MATGKYDAAIEDFNAALNVNANNSEAWAGLGLCYEKLNNHAKGSRILPACGNGQSQQRRSARSLAAIELTAAARSGCVCRRLHTRRSNRVVRELRGTSVAMTISAERATLFDPGFSPLRVGVIL